MRRGRGEGTRDHEEATDAALLRYRTGKVQRIETDNSYLVFNDDGKLSNEEGSMVEEALAMRFNPP